MVSKSQKSLKIALIIIGDEILMGRTKEANMQRLAISLQNKGLELNTATIIQDDVDTIVQTIEQFSSQHQLIIVSGGLGPTEDDKTKLALAKLLGSSLAISPDTIALVQKHYQEYGRTWTTDTNSYHLLPENVLGLFNPAGLAPGLKTETQQSTILCLPGVPKEFNSMLEYHLPTVLKQFDADQLTQKQNLILRTQGVPEEEIFLRKCPGLWELLSHYGSPSSLPGFTGVDIVIKGVSQDMSKITQEIIEHAQFQPIRENLWHIGPQDPLELLIEEVKKHQWTLSTAESCTGGLLSSMITDVAGSSQYFLGSIISYDNSLKENLLHVSSQRLQQHGAVSKEVAEAMAKGALLKTGSDISLSTTGIAGPDGGSEDKPVGTVYFGLAYKQHGKVITTSLLKQYRGNRTDLKTRFAIGCCLHAYSVIKQLTS